MKLSMLLCIGRYQNGNQKVQTEELQTIQWPKTKATMNYETSQSKQDKSFSNTGVNISAPFLGENVVNITINKSGALYILAIHTLQTDQETMTIT